MNNCIFCKIIKGEIPSKIVHKEEDFIVFHDINPKAPVHVLIVPVKHIESLRRIEEKDGRMITRLMLSIRKIAEKLGITDGYKVVINNGPSSGQIVFHLHIHLLGGWKKLVKWEV